MGFIFHAILQLMPFVDFIGEFLSAHAHALQRLAALMSEGVLIKLLEEEHTMPPSNAVLEHCLTIWENPAQDIVTGDGESPYLSLNEWIATYKLPAFLEFHVWSYPPYRTIIEGALTLDAHSKKDISPRAYEKLFDLSRAEAQAWVKAQKLDEPLLSAAIQTVDFAWLRFRTQMLKRLGINPLRQV